MSDPKERAAAVGEGISAEQFWEQDYAKHTPMTIGGTTLEYWYRFAEAYAMELRKERDALRQELQDEHDADKEIQAMLLKYQAAAERAESALAEARSKALDEAAEFLDSEVEESGYPSQVISLIHTLSANLLALKDQASGVDTKEKK